MYRISFRKNGVTIEAQSTGGRILLIVLLLAAMIPVFLRCYSIFIAEVLLKSGSSLENYNRAVQYDPSNGEYWWIRGRFRLYSLDPVEESRAVADFKQALKLNPRLGQAWIDLADACEKNGNDKAAESSLQNALRVQTYSPSINWQAGNFYLLRGNLSKMYQFFKIACEYDRGKLKPAIDLAWKADLDHAGIEKKLIPGNLPDRIFYFHYLVGRDELDLARIVWEKSLKDPVPYGYEYKVSVAFGYIDRLIGKKRVEEALEIWKQALKKAGSNPTDQVPASPSQSRSSKTENNLIWNGSFEREAVRGGWGWRYHDLPGTELRIDQYSAVDGQRSLELSFRGVNVKYSHLRQLVPTIVPGHYRLTCHARTKNLTTDQRPYFLVQDFPETKSVLLRTEMLPENSTWNEYSWDFVVSPGTRAVRLTLARDLSQKLGNQIRGTLWLDKVSVHPVR